MREEELKEFQEYKERFALARSLTVEEVDKFAVTACVKSYYEKKSREGLQTISAPEAPVEVPDFINPFDYITKEELWQM